MSRTQDQPMALPKSQPALRTLQTACRPVGRHRTRQQRHEGLEVTRNTGWSALHVGGETVCKRSHVAVHDAMGAVKLETASLSSTYHEMFGWSADARQDHAPPTLLVSLAIHQAGSPTIPANIEAAKLVRALEKIRSEVNRLDGYMKASNMSCDVWTSDLAIFLAQPHVLESPSASLQRLYVYSVAPCMAAFLAPVLTLFGPKLASVSTITYAGRMDVRFLSHAWA